MAQSSSLQIELLTEESVYENTITWYHVSTEESVYENTITWYHVRSLQLGGVQIIIGKKTSLYFLLFDFPHLVTKMMFPLLDLRLQLCISLSLPQDSAEVEAGADISFLDSKKTLNFKTVRADHQVLLL